MQEYGKFKWKRYVFKYLQDLYGMILFKMSSFDTNFHVNYSMLTLWDYFTVIAMIKGPTFKCREDLAVYWT